MTARQSRPFWTLQRREARAHAVILAAILWSSALVFVVFWPGDRDFMGTVKGSDFVHFYTLGSIVQEGRLELLHDFERQHDYQVGLVPASTDDAFMPVYVPQTGLLFAPFATLPYGLAALAWAAVTIGVYAGLIVAAYRSAEGHLGDGLFVAAAAAGFPPFWNLVLHGQTTTVLLLGLWLGWWALARGRDVLAGMAFGLWLLKPQFGLVLAVVVLATRNWRMVIGAALSGLIQVVAVAGLLGPAVLVEYVDVIRRLSEFAPVLEPRPYQMHSLAAVTKLLPAPVDVVLWAIVCVAVTWTAVRVWQARQPLPLRLALLVTATALVNPHMTVYDVTILAPALLWAGAWVESGGRQQMGRWYWPSVYVLFVTLLVPTALLIRVQLSVFILGFVFFRLSHAVRRAAPVP